MPPILRLEIASRSIKSYRRFHAASGERERLHLSSDGNRHAGQNLTRIGMLHVFCRYVSFASTVILATTLLSPAIQAAEAIVTFPLGRNAYFIGECVPLAFRSAAGPMILEVVGKREITEIYRGPAQPLFLDTARLAPGEYQLKLNSQFTGDKFTLTSVIRPMPGSLQDEAVPDAPWGPEAMRESGISTCVALGASDSGRLPVLETMASSGALLLVNPDTRPTSFFPTGNAPWELDGMSQPIILTAQANGRYPNFGGFCYGWDTTGFAVGGRDGLLTYWGWGDKTDALRQYIAAY